MNINSMSNFFRLTKNPRTGEWAQASWLDMRHKYIVKFPNGDEFDEEEIKTWHEGIPINKSQSSSIGRAAVL